MSRTSPQPPGFGGYNSASTVSDDDENMQNTQSYKSDRPINSSRVSDEQREFAAIIKTGQLENDYEVSQFDLSRDQINQESFIASMAAKYFDECNCFEQEIAGIKHKYYGYTFVDPTTSALGAVDCSGGKNRKLSYICEDCIGDGIVLYGYFIKHLEIINCPELKLKRTLISRTYLQSIEKPVAGDKTLFLLDIIMTTCKVCALYFYINTNRINK
jgi:hypothetical protein